MYFKDLKGISYYLSVRYAWDGDPMTWNEMWKGIKFFADTPIGLRFCQDYSGSHRQTYILPILSVIKTKLEEGDEDVFLFSVADDNAAQSCGRIMEKFRKFSTYW